jgi:hypothetical protein
VFKVEEGELFKGCKYIDEFILKHKKKPTRSEIAVFYYNRYVESAKKATLPFQTQLWIEQLLAQFEAAYPEGAEIKDIISCIRESRTVEKRQLMESTA